jgi:hypothetical protein
MPQAAYSVQTPTIENSIKFISDTNNLAATLAALTAKVRAIRTEHAIRVATLAS